VRKRCGAARRETCDRGKLSELAAGVDKDVEEQRGEAAWLEGIEQGGIGYRFRERKVHS